MFRVLIVDDEPHIRSLYRLELEDAGFEVKTAADGMSAMHLLRQWDPELAVLDIRLGEENGLDLLRQMVEARKSLLTILISGYPGYKDDFTSWLADAFLTKSGDTSELTHKVQELLSTHPVG